MSDEQGQVVAAELHPVHKEVEMKFKAPSQKSIDAAKKEGTEIPTQRPAFNVQIPQYTTEQVLAILGADPKILQFATELLNQQIFDEARAQVTDPDNPVNSDTELRKNELTLQYIANLSAADRASRIEISKEQLAAFATIFEKVMPAITGYDPAGIKILAQALKTRLAQWKQKPEVLEKVRTLLRQFASGVSPDDLSANEEVLEYLDSICQKFIEKPAVDKLQQLLQG